MSRPRASDDGSVLAEFTLVALLVTGIFLGLVQLGLDLYTRNVLQGAAADAARYAANADVESPSAGAGRAAELVHSSAGGLAVHVSTSAHLQDVGGASVVVVEVRADLPTAFGWLPSLPLHVQGRALLEPRP